MEYLSTLLPKAQAPKSFCSPKLRFKSMFSGEFLNKLFDLFKLQLEEAAPSRGVYTR